MEKLNTIQEREKLNDIYAVGSISNGGAYHIYSIEKSDDNRSLCAIYFQNGSRKDVNSLSGILDCDLLEIVRHRLQCFQSGSLANKYNAEALEHVELALQYMNARVEDRIERNVLGTMNK